MKKYLIGSIAVVLLLALTVACGGGSEGRFVEPPANWDDPYSETVKMTAVSAHGTNWSFEGDDDINNNPWTRLYKDKLNIEVSFDWTSTDEYDTRLNMAISAGNLPDVWYIPNTMDPRTFNQLQEQDMILDITDAYNNYASARIRGFENADPYTIQGYIVDGKLYGVPRYYYGQIDQPWHLWIRKDWYEAEGSPEIRTVEDMENLARAFMNNHGAAYGIGVDSDLQWLLRSAPMFGAYVGNIHENSYFWIPDSTGRLKPGITFPEFEVALARWADWFEEGLISPEFPAMEPWGRGQEDVIMGRMGMHVWWQWWGWYGHNVVVDQGDDSYFIPFNLPTLDGNGIARGQIFYPNTGVVVANKDFNNPAALMKVQALVDVMKATDVGLTSEEVRYYFDEGREHTVTMNFHIIDPTAEQVQYEHVLHALQTGDDSNLFTPVMKSKFDSSLDWLDNKNPAGLGAYLQMGFDGSAYARSQHLFDTNNVIRTSMWGLPPAEFANVGASGDILMENLMAIIMGHRPASDWPQVIDQWYAQGGQIKEDAVNAHFR